MLLSAVNNMVQLEIDICPLPPGKNTGMGCHFLLQFMKVKSESEIAQSCPTLATPWTAARQAPRSMGFSRREYWSGVPLPSPNTHTTVYKTDNQQEPTVGFPGGASGKDPACQCRRHKRSRFDLWAREISWRRKWQHTPVFLPGDSHE